MNKTFTQLGFKEGDRVKCLSIDTSIMNERGFKAGNLYTLFLSPVCERLSCSNDYNKGYFTGILGTWELVKDDLITMESKYALRSSPTEQVKVLTIDAAGEMSVIVQSITKRVYHCNKYGGVYLSDNKEPARLDLVPLEQPPIELWVNVYPDRVSGVYKSRDEAKNIRYDNGKTILMREVKDNANI